MRCILLVVLIIAKAIASIAQQAAPLPDYFNNKTYTISRTLRTDDSVAVKKELSRLADSIYVFSKKADRNLSATDTALRCTRSLGVAVAAACKGRFQEAYDAVMAYNQLQRQEATVDAENMLLELCILSHLPRPGGAVLADEIRKKINALSEYQEKDYMRALKEAAQPDYISRLQQMMNVRLGSLKYDNYKLSYDEVRLVLQSALLKKFLQQNQVLLEVALYLLDGTRVKKNELTIPMRDGVQLRAMVFRDINATEKQPAIICTDLYSGNDETDRGELFANHGYAYVYVHHRGCSESPGNFMPFEHDGTDFYDAIDWVSKQSWCNGTVGATGSDYAGYVQWQAMRKQYKHPALKAINPISAIAPGINYPTLGGVFYPFTLLSLNYTCNIVRSRDFRKWGEVLWEMYNRHIPFSKLDSLLGIPNPVFQKWLSHSDFDDYWKSLLPDAADYAAMDLPVLTITGYNDNQAGSMYYYNNHCLNGGTKGQKNHHLLIGPYSFIDRAGKPHAKWDSGDMEEGAQVPVFKYILEWFDWKLKGKPQPYWIKDQITWFATGAGHWKGANSFQEVTADTLRFYLSTAPVMAEKRRTIYQMQPAPITTKQNLLYRHNISEALDSAFLNRAVRLPGDSFMIASPYNIIFETPPFENEFLLSGRIAADLYVSLNVPDADFVIAVTEVTRDGKTEMVGASPLRCRYRRGADKPVLMTPGQVEKLCFDNGFIYMKKVAKGNRLRLTLTSMNGPNFEKNYGFGGVVANESTPSQRYIEATIMMSQEHPTCIKIPVGKW